MKLEYKRVLLKLSGEMLGENGRLFDHGVIDHVARVLVQIAEKTQLGVVIGAGNIWRGRSGGQMDRVTADQMGMLGTVINCLAMRDAVQRAGGKAVVMSAIEMPRVCEVFNAEKAREYMNKGYVTLFAGGSGNPFFSTDTAVVLRAVETGADAILLAKNIDGVYSADPAKDPTAVKFDRISFEEVLARRLGVMDSTATSLAMDNHMPILVFALKDPENIYRAVTGAEIGTLVSE